MLQKTLLYPILFILAIIVSGVYGAIHDQISFSISEEYFRKFKYKQFGYEISALPDRTKVALIGIKATWWMGIPIGLIVGAYGFIHPNMKSMFINTLLSYGVIIACAAIIGLIGFIYGWYFASHSTAQYSNWYFPDTLDSPKTYITVGHLHSFGYLGGALGIIIGAIFQRLKKKRDLIANVENEN